MKSAIVNIPPKEVQVVLDGEARIDSINADEIAKSAQKLGMQCINSKYVSELNRIGGLLNGPGVVRLATGGAFVSQQVLLYALGEMRQLMESADDELKPEYAPKIGYLADKLTRVSSTMLKMSDTVRASEEAQEKPKRKSFEPCTVIQNNYYGKDSPKPKIEPQ